MITGLGPGRDDLQKKAGEIATLVRRFNIREGLRPEQDTLPSSIFKRPLPSGHGITEAELQTMVRDYYSIRGWSSEGVPLNPPPIPEWPGR